LANLSWLVAGSVNALGEGPVAVSETTQANGLKHALGLLFDGPANGPVAAATATMAMALAASRLFISASPSGR
jgi:hypothetical protein